jgi:nucleoid-associated protein YgaU
VNRPVVFTAVGVVIVLLAIGMNVLLWEKEVGDAPPPEPATTSQSTEPQSQPQPQPQRQAKPEPEAPVVASKPTSPGPVPPTFDVVRVNPKGDAVMAGRAEPGNTVIVMDGDDVVGLVKADDRGEWVFVPEKPLPPGNRQLSLETPVEGKKPILSEDVVVLVVPEKGTDIAGRPATKPSQPLALKVPRSGAGAAVVLQKPAAGALPPPPATAVTAAAPPPATETTPTTQQIATAMPQQPQIAVVPRQPQSVVAPAQPQTVVAPTQPGTVIAPQQPQTVIAPQQPGTVIAPQQPGTVIAPQQPGTVIAPQQPQTVIAPQQPQTVIAPTPSVISSNPQQQTVVMPQTQTASATPLTTVPVIAPKKPVTGGAAAPLTVDAVNYDDAGQLGISGHAEPGAPVQLYLNNQFLGRGQTDANGAWTLNPTARVLPGLYTLRADHVDAAGKVLARVEIPFARAEPLGDMPPGGFIIVQPGNSLWRIARRTYGSGFGYSVIYDANRDQIKDPDLIYPGQIFTLPTN